MIAPYRRPGRLASKRADKVKHDVSAADSAPVKRKEARKNEPWGAQTQVRTFGLAAKVGDVGTRNIIGRNFV